MLGLSYRVVRVHLETCSDIQRSSSAAHARQCNDCFLSGTYWLYVGIGTCLFNTCFGGIDAFLRSRKTKALWGGYSEAMNLRAFRFRE